jgi:copper(I)-binding protein
MNAFARYSVVGAVLAWPWLALAGGPTVSHAWARATPPGLSVGAAYFTITGGSGADDLVGASTPVAAMAEMHTMDEQGGMATMREVERIHVPAGKTVVLAPSGTHVMLMGLGKPLVAGQTFPLKLEFANSPAQIIEVTVLEAGATGPPGLPAH